MNINLLKFYFILEHIVYNDTPEKENIANENSTVSGIEDAVICKGKEVLNFNIVSIGL